MSSYDPFYPSSSSSSSYRRWYAEAPAPRVALTRGRSHSLYSSSSSSAARPRYSSPGRGSSSSSPALVELQLSQATQVSADFRAARTQERAQMQQLNDRFAGFIERVRDLEQQNRALEGQLTLLRQRHAEPSHLRALYEQEARALRSSVDQARAEQQAALGQRDRLEQNLSALQARYEEELLAREAAEGKLMEARRAADEASLGRAEMEKRVESLLQELAFLKKIHEGELAELQAQAQMGVQIAIESETAAPDLSGALRDIRAQYERLAAMNMQSAEEWFRGKVGSMTESAAQRVDAVRTSKGEAGEYRRQLQARLLEIDACRGLNQALEKQLHDIEEKQSAEVAAMQDTIMELENELRGTKQEMTRYLKDYQDLLNVKMALDIEIAAYRKLLEGEESRFDVGVARGMSATYSHTLSATPSFHRPTFTTTMTSSMPYIMTSRLLSSTYRKTQQAEASPSAEQEEEEKEQEEEGGEEKGEEEEEEKEDGEEVKGGDQGGDDDAAADQGGEDTGEGEGSGDKDNNKEDEAEVKKVGGKGEEKEEDKPGAKAEEDAAKTAKSSEEKSKSKQEPKKDEPEKSKGKK